VRRWAWAVVLLVSIRALAQPPPDPWRGERRDGRVQAPHRASQGALWIPRILLAPIRYAIVGLGYAFKPFLDFDERHHIHQRIYNLTTSHDGLVGVRPIAWWHSGYMPMFGLYYFDRRTLGPDSAFNVGFSTFGEHYVDALAHVEPSWGPAFWRVFVDANFNRRFDHRFTGIGNSTHFHNPASRYAETTYAFGVGARVRAPWWLTFNGGISSLGKRFGNGDRVSNEPGIIYVYDTAGIPGFIDGEQLIRILASVTFDTRRQRATPYNGVMLRADADYSHGLGADHSSYFRVRGALDLPISLWRGTHVLDLRAQTTMVAPIGDDPVPFSELAVLGGPDDLRGFNMEDFRDFTSLVVTGEYRWPIWMWMDAMLFVDYGGVFGRWYNGFGASRMQPDVGVGVRFYSLQNRFRLRAHAAYGFGEGWSIYISGSTP
jgi:hypothetical protein